MAFPEHPIPLIELDDNEAFVVNQEAVEMLNAVSDEVAVVAVAGLYRTGKSSLLNWLLERQAGFTVGPTVQRCTRGLWVWGTPKRVQKADGTVVQVVVLDTEGIGGMEADSTYDARIFSLATLLCSTLIYNSLGSVDENAISNLSFVANLTKMIRVRAAGEGEEDEEDGEGDAQEFQRFFPTFLWVVRDFSLELVDEYGEPISSADYLERALATQSGFDAQTMERNRVRQMLTAFFPERNCITLVRPLSDEDRLQQVDQVPYEELRDEFRDSMDYLRRSVFERVRPKTMSGRALTGPMFAGLVEAYVGAINSGGVPTISSAWEGVTLQECRSAKAAALEQYRQGMEAAAAEVAEEAALREAHDALREAALTAYNGRAVGDAARGMRDELLEKIGEELARVLAANEAASRAACEGKLQALFQELIAGKLGADGEGYTDVEQLKADFAVFRERYLAEAAGPGKLPLLAAFVESKYGDAVAMLVTRLNDQFERRMREEEEKRAEVEERLSLVAGREEVFREKMAAQQQEQAELMSARARLEAETEAQNRRLEEVNVQYRSGERAKETLEHEKEQVQKQKREADDALRALQAEYEAMQKQLQEREAEISMLEEEVTTAKKGSTCACVVS